MKYINLSDYPQNEANFIAVIGLPCMYHGRMGGPPGTHGELLNCVREFIVATHENCT